MKAYPTNAAEMAERGWDFVDFIMVTGDAFVDHSSFGSAIIAGVLARRGFRVGVIAQPDWRNEADFKVFGRPRHAFMVSSGNMDSMVCHYTVNKKIRRDDAYTPGGKHGRRPDRAVIVYCQMIRRIFDKVPIVVGGIEASLRRFAHYDYWQDTVRRPILADCGADLLVYGMGEKATVEIAEALEAGLSIGDLTYIRGTGVMTASPPDEGVGLPSFEDVKADKKAFAKMAALIYHSNDAYFDYPYYQAVGHRYFIQNPAQMPLSEIEMDDVYDYAYTGAQLTPGDEIPCLSEVRFSLTVNRGCFGNCAFCAIALHQGRMISARSEKSILKEAKAMTALPGFKGYIHDVGGPTANFFHPACEKQRKSGVCRHRECLFPKPCPNLDADETDYAHLLAELRALPGVKKVFIRSGIRYDYLLLDHKSKLLESIVKHHVSGQLRVAPEHICDHVLSLMRKPDFDQYLQFVRRFNKLTAAYGKNQYIVPYFISSHPGTTLADALDLALFFRDTHAIPEQVQDFYPTPGSIATAMYYTGYDPFTMRRVHVPKGREKTLQRALLQVQKPENYALVKEALLKLGRKDLISFGPDALIPPRQASQRNFGQRNGRAKSKKRKGKNNHDRTQQKRHR